MKTIRHFVEHLPFTGDHHHPSNMSAVVKHCHEFHYIRINQDTIIGKGAFLPHHLQHLREHKTCCLLPSTRFNIPIHEHMTRRGFAHKITALGKGNNEHGLDIHPHHTTIDLIQQLVEAGNTMFEPET